MSLFMRKPKPVPPEYGESGTCIAFYSVTRVGQDTFWDSGQEMVAVRFALGGTDIVLTSTMTFAEFGKLRRQNQ